MSFQKQPDGRIACTCEPIRQEVVCLAKTQKQEAKTRIRGRLFFLLNQESFFATLILSQILLCPFLDAAGLNHFLGACR